MTTFGRVRRYVMYAGKPKASVAASQTPRARRVSPIIAKSRTTRQLRNPLNTTAGTRNRSAHRN